MNPSAQMIVMLNIKHYRKLLETESDPAKRAVISKLLAEEQQKLAEVRTDPQSSTDGSPLPPMSGVNKDPSAR